MSSRTFRSYFDCSVAFLSLTCGRGAVVTRRIALATAAALVTAIPAAADPAATPAATPVFTVTCEVNGAPIVFHLIGTGVAGHVLEDSRIAILLNATFTFFVNGVQVDQQTFVTPGEGRPAAECAAFTEFLDEQGNLIRIEITNGQILLTPPVWGRFAE